jgi:UDP-N-acetylglucosamine--N-acetylmuramyl-(pentapeptide) pyrophosphoryl-undecaprenol N-acetylglucosamine transferase
MSLTFILAGGGSGGHLYPGLAVAAELTRLHPDATIVFACANRDIDRRILSPLKYVMIPQPVRPLPRRVQDVLPFLSAWRKSGRLAKDLVRDLAPAAVLGLGGFAAGPVVKEAARAGVASAILNPDAVPGKANQYLARWVDAVFTQFSSTQDCFPQGIRGKIQHVGCPVRRELLGASREEAMRHFGLRGDRKTLLVFGGSLLATSLTDAVLAMANDLDSLADAWQVLYVSGPQRLEQAQQVHAKLRIHARSLAYCDRMEYAFAAADLTLCRAGASTIAELAATAVPAVVMPYPHHKDQHQRLNAVGLAQAGAAVIVDDARDAHANAESLRRQMLPILKDPAALEKMRLAAAEFGKTSAAAVVAQWMSRQAGQKPENRPDGAEIPQEALAGKK